MESSLETCVTLTAGRQRRTLLTWCRRAGLHSFPLWHYHRPHLCSHREVVSNLSKGVTWWSCLQSSQGRPRLKLGNGFGRPRREDWTNLRSAFTDHQKEHHWRSLKDWSLGWILSSNRQQYLFLIPGRGWRLDKERILLGGQWVLIVGPPIILLEFPLPAVN